MEGLRPVEKWIYAVKQIVQKSSCKALLITYYKNNLFHELGNQESFHSFM